MAAEASAMEVMKKIDHGFGWRREKIGFHHEFQALSTSLQSGVSNRAVTRNGTSRYFMCVGHDFTGPRLARRIACEVQLWKTVISAERYAYCIAEIFEQQL
jgi:hypothetical protein